MKNYKPLIANIIAQTIFGFTFLFMKMGMAVLNQDSVKFLAFRYSTGFIAMTLLLLIGLMKVDFSAGKMWLLVICGIFNPCISQLAETIAIAFTPTSQIALYESLLPIIMLLLSSLINREYPTRKQLLLVCICVAGVIVTNLGDMEEGAITTLGIVLIAITIISSAICRVIVRRASEFYGSFDITYIMTTAGALFFSTVSVGDAAVSGNLSHYLDGLLSPELAVSILYMGIGSCVCAFLLSNYAAANLPFAVYSSTCTLGTVVAILAGVIILREPFTTPQMIGTIIIVAGVTGISFTYDTTDNSQNRYHAREKISKENGKG